MLCYKLVGDNSEFILLIRRISSIGIYEQDSLFTRIRNCKYIVLFYIESDLKISYLVSV